MGEGWGEGDLPDGTELEPAVNRQRRGVIGQFATLTVWYNALQRFWPG